jgi:hypothetical protein
MNCRICDAKCEKEEPQYQGLCRTCGQKRETYVVAIVSSGEATLDQGHINKIFDCAEMLVKRDRTNGR